MIPMIAEQRWGAEIFGVSSREQRGSGEGGAQGLEHPLTDLEEPL